MKFDMYFSKKFLKFTFSWNLTTINGTLPKGFCTFMIISRWILLRTRNFSDKFVGKTQKTRFVFNLLLLLLALQPTMGFSLLSDFLPFRPFFAQFPPTSYSHRLEIFFNIFPYSFPYFVSEVCSLRAVRFCSLSSSQRFSFSGAGLAALCPTPNLEDQGIPFRLDHHLWPVWHGRPCW